MKETMDNQINDLTQKVIGAAIEVHRHFGPGFQESTYHRALCLELDHVGVAYESEVPVDLKYRGHVIGQGRIDLLIDEKLIVELKATAPNRGKYRRQVGVYLKAMGLSVGLIINFEAQLLKEGITRVIETVDSPALCGSEVSEADSTRGTVA